MEWLWTIRDGEEVKDVLLIYNICGINERNNLDAYVESIESFVCQAYSSFDICISSCLSSSLTLNSLKKVFPNISIHEVKDKVPVNITFNKTVLDSPKYKNYLYLDSGLIFKEKDILSRLMKYRLKDVGILSILTDTDCVINHLKMTNINKPYQLQVGEAINGHVELFSSSLLDYYGKIIPDIFAAQCTESTYSFLCAALKLKWVVLPFIKCHHRQSLDGASAGFPNPGTAPWAHTFRDIREVIYDADAIKNGLGYEECNRVMMHDPSQFDAEGFCTNEDLKDDIKRLLYLPKNILDYDQLTKEIL